MTDHLRVLVLDDAPLFRFAFHQVLTLGAPALPAPAEVLLATSVAEVQTLLDAGTPIDVALVDLGLGDGVRSGLGAIELLEQRSDARIAVHSDYSDHVGRLMFIYAAFSWYRPLALLSKTDSSHEGDPRWAALAIARIIAEVYHGRIPRPDCAARFRHDNRRDRPFDRVLHTPEDLRNWQGFVHYPSTRDVAAALRLSRKSVENWVADKYEQVQALLAEAEAAGIHTAPLRLADSTSASPSDPARASGAEGSPRNRPSQMLIRDFAVSQAWFFTDPVVHARFEYRRTRH